MDFLQKILGGGDKNPVPASSPDDGFADFAEAPNPSPVRVPSYQASSLLSSSFPPSLTATPGYSNYTQWYRVWERHSPQDFMQEGLVALIFLPVLFFLFWGRRANRTKAHDWAHHHVPILEFEFAQVGIDPQRESGSEPESALVENAANEWTTYATGRKNTAFVDVKITLHKRYNPLIMLGEQLIGLAFQSLPPPTEQVNITCYSFGNKESNFGVQSQSVIPSKYENSSYDGFVWAIVNKNILKTLKDGRYDLGLTTTKDHIKLPNWVTVMTESSEITDMMLTQELIKAVEDAGDLFNALIITDQPLERPHNLDQTVPKNRFTLSHSLPSLSQDYVKLMPLFAHFMRLNDLLVKKAHFRPEVARKLRQTRDQVIKGIIKIDEDSKSEERKAQADREKKEKRDDALRAMTADQQTKFLEKEREKERKKSQKRVTMRS